ncbi:hypothetical protein V6N11_006356 [Hibiscus sabdariffa]|uniref:Bifunctional inhibitor/plant lipid transfer protein/seed storage helical domain-containing protein n=1 Tax=Hibiscus sabdariffa TaxID=183260 RepID=A0ABR2RQV7_9ROSI
MLNINASSLDLRMLPLAVAVMVVASATGVGADSTRDKDKEECTQQLVGLATCLPYVEGSAKAPTPDCCSGLKQVLKNNKKCLCVIIKDRNDPDLGLNLNVTLALALPSVCNAPANVSKCPELLHMDPNSPEAQIFYQLSNNSTSNGGDASPAAAPTGGEGEGEKSPDIQKGDGCRGKTWLGLDSIVALWILLLCSFLAYF